MQAIYLVLAVIIFCALDSVNGKLELELESFDSLPDSDPTFMNYGTVRVSKKKRNLFVLSGEFEFMKNFGDEIIVSG